MTQEKLYLGPNEKNLLSSNMTYNEIIETNKLYDEDVSKNELLGIIDAHNSYKNKEVMYNKLQKINNSLSRGMVPTRKLHYMSKQPKSSITQRSLYKTSESELYPIDRGGLNSDINEISENPELNHNKSYTYDNYKGHSKLYNTSELMLYRLIII